MYELTIGLRYNKPLELNPKYRYDFVGIDYHNDFIYGCIFVFRTIKEGKAKGNILIDLVHNSNIDAISAHIHGDCHFHIFKDRFSIGNKSIKITENIFLEKTENTSNDEYYASLKEQQYRLINGVASMGSDCKHFPIVKYLLFTEYHEPLANMDMLELAPIFKLQEEHIWHNNRHWDYHDISTLDINDSKLNPSIQWCHVKKVIKNQREHQRKQREEKYNQILHLRDSQKYLPIE
ncbi:TPA: hypothetical protein QCX59_004233 [Bacillus mycoides]|nr:hypothetical protein [Bacillus mycoides]